MQKSNVYNLPIPLYDAVGDDHKPVPDELHVTTLIGPALPWHLKLKHWDELEDDASNRLWALMGSALHTHIAGSSKLKRAIVIIKDLIGSVLKLDIKTVLGILKDLYHELVDGDSIEPVMRAKSGKWTIIGSNDHYDEDAGFVVMDWKMTSVWSVIYADHTWEEQLNMYAWLRRKNGYVVKRLEVWALLRDWQKSKMMKDPDYPCIPFVRAVLPLWSFEEQERYVAERLQLFETEPRECTPKEKWQTPTVFKVMKKDRKSALIATYWENGEKHTIMTQTEALHAASIHTKKVKGVVKADPIKIDGKKYWIEEVPGENKRCENYCIVNEHCKYYKETK